MKRFLRVLLMPINLGILLIFLFVFLASNNILFILPGILLPIIISFIKLRDKDFLNELGKKELIESIKILNNECNKLLEPFSHSTNSEKRLRIRKVIKIKDEIFLQLLKDKDRLLKQKIAKQSIELTMSYGQLLENYYSRLKEIDEKKIGELNDRISQNKSRLSETTDENRAQLEENIELDNKLLDSIKSEKEELNSINVKLEYIESAISNLKQQMMSDIEGAEIFEGVNQIVNEVTALDNALTNIKREKQKL